LEQLAEQQAQQQHDEQPQHGCQEAYVLRAAQSLVLSDSFRLSVPLLKGSLAAAARVALLARALMPPLRAILVQHQLFSTYETVERPLQRVFAGVRASGLIIGLDSIRARLQDAEQQRTVLHQHASALLLGYGSIDIGMPAHVRSLLSHLQLVLVKREQQQPLTTTLQQAVRNASRCNRQQHLPLIRCLLTYHMLVSWEQLLKAMIHLASTSGSGVGVALQPLPYATALCGDVLVGLPSGVESLLQHYSASYLPVVASEGSLSDLGMASLVSPTPVIAFVPSSSIPSPHAPLDEHRLEPWLGMLCAVREQEPANAAGSPLPLHGTHANDDACTQLGCVRYWCSVTHTMQEVQLGMSLLHTLEAQPLSTCPRRGAVNIVLGTVSLLSAAQPKHEACTFAGLNMQQLSLLVLASMSKDPVLLAALSTSDPLAAAAAHWADHNGLQSSTISMLLSRVAAGAVDGVPIMASLVPRALFSVAVDALVLGQKPSVLRGLLGLEQSVDLGDTLLVAFPGLATWREDVLEECRRTG
jgi:hypothetical protein